MPLEGYSHPKGLLLRRVIVGPLDNKSDWVGVAIGVVIGDWLGPLGGCAEG